MKEQYPGPGSGPEPQLLLQVRSEFLVDAQGAGDGLGQVAGIQRLFKQSLDRRAPRLVGKLRPTEAAHEQDRDIRTDLPQARGKLGTTHARHELIGYDEIKTRRPRLERLEGGLTVLEPDGFVAEGRDHLLTEEHERLVVVDEEDGLAATAGNWRALDTARGDGVSGPREVDREAAPLPRCARNLDGTIVIAHDAVYQRQAEPGPLAEVLGSEEGIEDPIERGLVNPVSGVRYFEAHIGPRL